MIIDMTAYKANKNLQEFKVLMYDLAILSVVHGKDFDEVIKELGKIPLDDLTPEKIKEILEK